MTTELCTPTEVGITQGQLLNNLFNNNLEEAPQLPVPIEHNPISIILPYDCTSITTQIRDNIATNFIRYNTNNTWYQVTTSGTSPTTGTMIGQIQTSTTSTSTSIILPYNGTSTATTNGFYIGTSSTIPIYFNATYPYSDPTPIKERPIKKFVKNSIKRALKLLDNFGMEEDTKIFLTGKEIEISHPDSLFKFVISKRKYDNIIRTTEYPVYSTPFGLSLYTKSNIHIADLCIYAEDTPILDNLFMIAMYVKSGNEEDLLRIANYSRLCKDKETKEILALEYPYMKSKLLRN